MLFNYGSGQQWIDDNKKCRQIAIGFDSHADAAVRYGAYRLMEHIQDFIWSHWMLPLGVCLHRISTVAVMVDDFGQRHKTLTKNYFKLANLR